MFRSANAFGEAVIQMPLRSQEIGYSVLFRWFVGVNMDEPVWDATVFCGFRRCEWTVPTRCE